MSTSSLKSLASLTPIENTEIDPLDSLNKRRAAGNHSRISTISSPASTDSSRRLRRQEQIDNNDTKESSNLLDSSGTPPQNDLLTSNDSHWNMSINDTDNQTDRQSLQSDRTRINDDYDIETSESILKVRESSPTRTVNTVDDARERLIDNFDDDSESESESSSQTDDEDSLNEGDTLESSKVKSESRTEASSRAETEYGGSRTHSEQRWIQTNKETPDFNSQSENDSGSSTQLQSSTGMPLNDTPRDFAPSRPFFSPESHGDPDSTTSLSNDRRLEKDQSNDVMRSLDSVEHSYFASFQTPEKSALPASEPTRTERTTSSVLRNLADSTFIFDTGDLSQDNTLDDSYRSKDLNGQLDEAAENEQANGGDRKNTLNDSFQNVYKEIKSSDTHKVENDGGNSKKVREGSLEVSEQGYETGENFEDSTCFENQPMLRDSISQNEKVDNLKDTFIMYEDSNVENCEKSVEGNADNDDTVKLSKLEGDSGGIIPLPIRTESNDENGHKLNGLIDSEDEEENRSVAANNGLEFMAPQGKDFTSGSHIEGRNVADKTSDKVNIHTTNVSIHESEDIANEITFHYPNDLDCNVNQKTLDAVHTPGVIKNQYPFRNDYGNLVDSNGQDSSAINKDENYGTVTPQPGSPSLPEIESASPSHQEDVQFETNGTSLDKSLTEPSLQVMERETKKNDSASEEVVSENTSISTGLKIYPVEEHEGGEVLIETQDEIDSKGKSHARITETKTNDTESEETTTEIKSMSRGLTTPLIEDSECGDSWIESQDEIDSKKRPHAGMIHASKSSSTLSVKTMSSSSSKLSTTSRKPKVENKKLERLLKGPYSENQKPPTPRLTPTRTKTVQRQQEKLKTKSDTDDKKRTPSKLQVHKTGRKIPDKLPPKSPRAKVKENPVKSKRSPAKPNDSNSTKSLLLSNSDQAVTRDSHPIKEADGKNENVASDIADSDTKTEQIIASDLAQPLAIDDDLTDQITSLGNDHVQGTTDIENNNKESTSSETSSLNTQRSNSLSVKTTGSSEESKSVPSESGETNKNSKGANQAPAQTNSGDKKPFPRSLLLGKKKIIISSPKASERLSAKEAKRTSLLKSNTNSTPTKVPNGKKIGSDKNGPKQVNGLGLTPTTITIIDETSDNAKTNSTAGRIVLNNIKMNLKKKSLQNQPAVTKTTKGKPKTPSPDEKDTGKNKETKLAYKTQSMSSLKVPGQTGVTNSWDPPKEEDTLSTCSRRPSMDSVSRKSVDYRIRNTTTVIQPQAEEKPKSVFNNDETFIQSAVPCLPLGLAVMCLILNTVFPGSGTAISGISILCCGQSRLSNKEDQVLNTMCANLVVGLAQLLTVSFLLVGWFWSVGWGIKMVSLSVQRREEIKQQREKELQTLALSAFGSPKRVNGFGI